MTRKLRTVRRAVPVTAALAAASLLAMAAARPTPSEPIAPAHPAHATTAFATTASAPAAPGQADSVRLFVLIVADQFRDDYLDRWRTQYRGGLARLLSEGTRVHAVHDHGITETAPGHAVLLAGRHPVHVGITDNAGGVNDGAYALLDTPGTAASPSAFQGTTLVDWLQAKTPATRALGVSRKDRGAILPLGRGRHAVYWYAPMTGRFTTSTWYADTLPTWLQAGHAPIDVYALAGREWRLLRDDSLYAEPDSVPSESGGQAFTFPHVLPRDSFALANVVIGDPVMDSLTMVVALAGMDAMQLGRGPQTDVLNVSLSATDAVGHRFGPESRELHDQVLRLDAWLGWFLGELETRVGKGRVLVAFTSDHGVSPIPTDARRIRREAFNDAIGAAVTQITRFELSADAFGFDGRRLTVDPAKIPVDTRGLRDIARAFARAAARVDGIARVDALADLLTRDTVKDDVARRWLHTFTPADGTLAVVTYADGAIPAGGPVATHGNPWLRDAAVPIVLLGPGIVPGVARDTARTIDLAPTLARLLGVTPTERLDGRAIPLP